MPISRVRRRTFCNVMPVSPSATMSVNRPLIRAVDPKNLSLDRRSASLIAASDSTSTCTVRPPGTTVWIRDVIISPTAGPVPGKDLTRK